MIDITKEITTEEELDEERFTDGLIFSLFEAWVDEFSAEPNHPETDDAIKRFATIEGCSETSPLAMMFMGFRAGAIKGLEVGLKIEAGFEEIA